MIEDITRWGLAGACDFSVPELRQCSARRTTTVLAQGIELGDIGHVEVLPKP